MIGREVNGSYVRFAQRHQHHDSKQPILVVYTDDGMSRHPNYISPNDEGKSARNFIITDQLYGKYSSMTR